MAAASPVRSWSMPMPTRPRRSATRRCCWRGWRRPSSRATASPARKRRARTAPASSSWTTACRMPRSPRISPWPSSMGGAASAMRACFRPGPLRAPLAAQLARTDALLVVGDGDGARDVAAAAPRTAGFPRPLAAGCGGGRRRSRRARCWPSPASAIPTSSSQPPRRPASRSPSSRAFADHHRFTAEEAAELIMQAEHGGLALLTTEKDRARMAGEPLLAALAGKTHVLPVTMVVEESGRIAPAGAREAAALATCRPAGAGAAAPPAARHRPPAIDAPVFELLERDRHAGHRAAHEGAGRTTRKSPSRYLTSASPFIGKERS